MTPTFLAWGRLVLVTDWVEMKSSCFSLSSLIRKGRSGSRKPKSRKAEIGLKKKKNQQLKDCSLTCFLIRSFIFFSGCVCISFATFYISYSKWVSNVTFCGI